MKLLILHFFQKQKKSTYFLDQCIKYPNEPQLLPSGGQSSFETNGYGARVICTIGDDPPKGF